MIKNILKVIAILCFFLLIVPFLGCIDQMNQQSANNEKKTMDQESDDDQNNTDLKNHSTQKNKNPIILNGFKISDYNISTYWRTGCCGLYEHHNESGFYNQLPMWSNASYIITGIVENVNESERVTAKINIFFKNEQQQTLFDLKQMNKSVIIDHLLQDEQRNFSVRINLIEYYYHCNISSFETVFSLFNEVESFEFDIIVIP